MKEAKVAPWNAAYINKPRRRQKGKNIITFRLGKRRKDV